MQGLQQQIAAQAVEQNLRAIASKIEDHLDDEMHKLDNMNEEEFDRLREQRLGALKKQQKKRQEWLRKGHGEYREVEEKEFFNEMKVSALNFLDKTRDGGPNFDAQLTRTRPLSFAPTALERDRERIAWCVTFTETTGPAR